jgi:hypothetical protein
LAGDQVSANERVAGGEPAGRKRAEKADPRLVMRQIMCASTWWELQGVLDQHAQAMNTMHLSALVARLAKIAPPPSQHQPPGLAALMQSVSALVSRSLDDMDARGLVRGPLLPAAALI